MEPALRHSAWHWVFRAYSGPTKHPSQKLKKISKLRSPLVPWFDITQVICCPVCRFLWFLSPTCMLFTTCLSTSSSHRYKDKPLILRQEQKIPCLYDNLECLFLSPSYPSMPNWKQSLSSSCKCWLKYMIWTLFSCILLSHLTWK